MGTVWQALGLSAATRASLGNRGAVTLLLQMKVL